MKKMFISALLVFCICTPIVQASELGVNITRAMKAEKYKGMEMKNIGGKTFVPVRVLSDEIGATIEFDNDGALRLWYDYSSYRFSKDTYWMPNIGGRLYLPLRDICNTMGLTTNYIDGNVYVKGPVGDKYDYDSNGMLTVGSMLSYRERFMKYSNALFGGLECSPLIANGDLNIEVVDSCSINSLGNVDILSVEFKDNSATVNLSKPADVVIFTHSRNLKSSMYGIHSGSNEYSVSTVGKNSTGGNVCYDYVGVYLLDEDYSNTRYSFVGQKSNHKLIMFRRPEHACIK